MWHFLLFPPFSYLKQCPELFFARINYCVMHSWGFNLHGWSCYYNDGEVVKKNIPPTGVITIKTFKKAINIAYGLGEAMRISDCGTESRL
jgi:hypothetical protein